MAQMHTKQASKPQHSTASPAGTSPAYTRIGLGVFFLLLLLLALFALRPQPVQTVEKQTIAEDLEYTGRLHKGEFTGEGTLTMPQGTYQGNFTAGHPEGRGVLKGENWTLTALWKEGVPSEEITVKTATGRTWQLDSEGVWHEIHP